MDIYYSLKSLALILKRCCPSKVVLVTQKSLAKKLKWAIEEIQKISGNKIKILYVPEGEKAKEWENLEKLLFQLAKLQIDRGAVLIAFGGGSVSDLVGFAASIYQRGISYINIPTTLLAQVDASIGGKTAINFQGHKNQLGTFHMPMASIIDLRFIKKLPDAQKIDGLAEIIKAGIIKDKNILSLLEKHKMAIFQNESALKKLISKSIQVKQFFITKDPSDKKERLMLNFGHTVGHALELKYSLSHGQAVLQGMLAEIKLGAIIGETGQNSVEYIKKIVKGLGLEIDNDKEIDWKAILFDKKIKNGLINLPVIKEIGQAELKKIKLANLKSILKKI
jgi:3-dehydroquinate synthase